jgi:hypothetical protein
MHRAKAIQIIHRIQWALLLFAALALALPCPVTHAASNEISDAKAARDLSAETAQIDARCRGNRLPLMRSSKQPGHG